MVVRASRVLLHLGAFLIATGALAWGCGGTLASSPDGGGGDASASSGGSSGGGASSSDSTSSSGGSGSSSSSGSSGSSSSGGSSSGGSCPPSCSMDTQCQQLCAPVASGTFCCDQASGACYATTNSTCPVPADDAGCPSGGPICAPDDAGNIPPNPNTGFTGCDDCIECSCAATWCTCMGDTGFDDAGSYTGCLGYAKCVIDCVNGVSDAGGPGMTASQCFQLCSPGYTPQQLQEGASFEGCIVGSCATPSTCSVF
jgi:hypothetical protein